MDGTFFGMRERPFRTTPDSRFVYPHVAFRQALQTLLIEARRSAGLLVLVGGPGTGKSSLLRCLKESFEAGGGVVFFRFYPRLHFDELLTACCEDAGIYQSAPGPMEKIRALADFLRERGEAASSAIVIIDEAQKVPDDLLHNLELLTEIREGDRSLLQVVLAGNRDLEARLARESLADIRRRVAVWTRLGPLASEEVGPYVRHRLTVAGYSGPDIFSPQAIERIARFSDGVPFIVNRLCDVAMQLAAVEASPQVSLDTLDRAAEECRLIDEKAIVPWGTGYTRRRAPPAQTATLGPRDQTVFHLDTEQTGAGKRAGMESPSTAEGRANLENIDWNARWRQVQPETADIWAVSPPLTARLPGDESRSTASPRNSEPAVTRAPGNGERPSGRRDDQGQVRGRRFSGATSREGRPFRRGHAIQLIAATIGAVLVSGAALLYYRDWRDERVTVASNPVAPDLSTASAPVSGTETQVAAAPVQPSTDDQRAPAGAMLVTQPREAAVAQIAPSEMAAPLIDIGPDIDRRTSAIATAEAPKPSAEIEASKAGAEPSVSTAAIREPPSEPLEIQRLQTIEPAAGSPSDTAVGASAPAPSPKVSPPAVSEPAPPAPSLPIVAAAPPEPAAQPTRPRMETARRQALPGSAVERMLTRGEELLQLGDPASARLLYERAAAEGSAQAATGVGRTHDPVEFSRLGLRGVRPDADLAASWYRRGLVGGDPQAATLLEQLTRWRRAAGDQR
jgi:type II secretory pathway predicted ATPase ExeA